MGFIAPRIHATLVSLSLSLSLSLCLYEIKTTCHFCDIVVNKPYVYKSRVWQWPWFCLGNLLAKRWTDMSNDSVIIIIRAIIINIIIKFPNSAQFQFMLNSKTMGLMQ